VGRLSPIMTSLPLALTTRVSIYIPPYGVVQSSMLQKIVKSNIVIDFKKPFIDF
jgi:hypothetical protein